MTSDAIPAPPVSPAPSALGRLAGVLFSPGETFASIARQPTWLAPLVIWTALSIGVTSVLMPKIDYEKMTRQAMEQRGQTIPEDRMASIIEQQKKIGGVIAWCLAGVAPAVIGLIVAVVIWGSFKAFGWDTTFRQAFGVTTHAFLPGMVKSPLIIFLITRQESVDPRALGDLLRSNLGFLVARDSSKALHSVLQSIDVFTLWSVFLFVVGFAAAAKIKKGPAAGVIVTLWLLVVAVGAAWSAIF